MVAVKRYVGIDPGKQGGIGWIDVNSKSTECYAASFKGMTPREIYELITDVVEDEKDCRVCIEHVHSMPKDSASNAFKFGYGSGMIEASVIAAKKPYEFVVPRKWQGKLRCLTKGDKSITRQRAQQIFPGFDKRITNQIADAMLLAEYCRQVSTTTTPQDDDPMVEVPRKKRRGRPRKQDMVVVSETVGEEITDTFLPDDPPKRKRGRPRKDQSNQLPVAEQSGGKKRKRKVKKAKRA